MCTPCGSSIPFGADPMPSTWPIIGNLTFLTNNNNGQAMQDWAEDRGLGCMMMMFGDHKVVCCNDQNTMKDSMSDDFVGRMGNISIPCIWTHNDKSVKNAQPPEWYSKRKFLETAIKEYAEVPGHANCIERGVEPMIDYFGKMADEGKPFQPLRELDFHTLNLSNLLGVGKLYDRDDEEAIKMHEGFKFFVDEFNKGVVSDYIGWMRKLYYPSVLTTLEKHVEYRDSVLRPVFDEHLPRYADDYEGKDDPQDLDIADILLKLRKENPEEYGHIDDESVFLMATADMSSGAVPGLVRQLEWILILLCNNPEWQDKVYEEITQKCDGAPKFDDLEDMPITRAFAKEALRYMAVVIYCIPHKAQRPGTIGGHKIPKETMILQNLWALCRSEENWGEDGTAFVPERWLQKKEDEDWSLKYVPFGRGDRMCPGGRFATDACIFFTASVVYNLDFTTRNIDETGKGQPIQCLYKNKKGLECKRREHAFEEVEGEKEEPNEESPLLDGEDD